MSTDPRQPSSLAPSAFGWMVVLALAACLALVVVGGRRWGPSRAAAAGGEVPRSSTPQTAPAPSSDARPLRERIGLTQLERELGRNVPTGRGVVAGHVEGELGEYLPDLTGGDYADLRIVPHGGPAKTSGHTQATARTIYGRGGLAPGIAEVHFFPANVFLGPPCLKTGAAESPDPLGIRLFNHSWIGPQGPKADEILRRLDYLADQSGALLVVGVNNKASSSVPALLGSAYNVIAVGQVSGDSSGGYTTVEVAGRCKPDIVAPGGLTSYATPVVTAMCARLLETADRHKDVSAARRPMLVRAALMAGAEKPESWRPADGKPLDEHLGAGSIRVDRSYHILAGKPQPPTQPAAAVGWDYRTVAAGRTLEYALTLQAPAAEASIVLTWNRRIDGRVIPDGLTGRKRWVDLPRLADLDLALLRADSDGKLRAVAVSASTIDNVEHVYVRQLPAGQYRLRAYRKPQPQAEEDWDYALAWRFQ